MKLEDGKEEARQRKAALTKRTKSNERRSRAIGREGMRTITLAVHGDPELIEAVRAHAHERTFAANYPVNETRDAAMMPISTWLM